MFKIASIKKASHFTLHRILIVCIEFRGTACSGWGGPNKNIQLNALFQKLFCFNPAFESESVPIAETTLRLCLRYS